MIISNDKQTKQSGEAKVKSEKWKVKSGKRASLRTAKQEAIQRDNEHWIASPHGFAMTILLSTL